MRLDFFGDEIESVKSFDPLTQRWMMQSRAWCWGRCTSSCSARTASNASTLPRYLRPGEGEDPLYESVSAGRLHAGLDTGYPCFMNRWPCCPTILRGPSWCSSEVGAAKDARLETINDFYQARKSCSRRRRRITPTSRLLPTASTPARSTGWPSRPAPLLAAHQLHRTKPDRPAARPAPVSQRRHLCRSPSGPRPQHLQRRARSR